MVGKQKDACPPYENNRRIIVVRYELNVIGPGAIAAPSRIAPNVKKEQNP
jgi:hypothetical protein